MLSRVQQWLVERAGLDAELLQREWLKRMIERRLSQLEMRSEADYCLLLERDAAERDRIIREISVGETSLFRYPASYELLLQHLRGLRERPGQRTRLRMLSVACATGEEPYSMAIAAVCAGWPVDSVSVDAIDRNADALAVAREGRYPSRRSRQQIPAWASPWMHVENDQLCVAAAIKSAVHFVCSDAVGEASSDVSGQYAVVFCRNLLIYLHDEARRRLIDNLAGWLEADGLLFAGHTEQPELIRGRFQMVPGAGAFALRRAAVAGAEMPDRTAPGRPPVVRLLGGENSSPDGTDAAGARPGVNSGSAGAGGIRGDSPRLFKFSADTAENDETSTRGATGTEPTPPDVSLLQRARAAADRGDLETALTAVQAALNSSPLVAEIYQLLGSIQLSRGCLPEARDALRRAVYLDAHHEQSLLQLAIVYQRLGDDAHASRYRRRAARAHQRMAGGSVT